ncbi:RNA-directed DNA polymerase, eukaryota [Tanacetum coccineum]
MGSYRTKEDDVSKISMSVFITNFPESFSAKDLFHSCKQYGHVVDTFTPTKRSKTGKRFGFVRFINVFNEERLVNNLCTIWIDRSKLHANIARFHRTPLNDKNFLPKKAGGVKSSNTHVFKKDTGVNGVGNSYMHVVKGQMQSGIRESESSPALVLNDECLLSKDLSKSLFGRVKQFASLANLKTALSNEGFVDIKIQYMGELWVLLEFVSKDSIKLFQDNVGVGSWFSQLKQASMDFNTEGRIAWVEIEGIPFKLWSGKTFKRIATKNIFKEFKIIFRGKVFWIRAKEAPGWVPDFMEESDDEEQNDDDSKDGGFKVHESGSCGGDSDVKGVPETIFEEIGQKKNNLDEEPTDHQENHSEDPFSIYTLLKKKKDIAENENNSDHSLKYPPSFTPNKGIDVVGMHAEESRSDNIVNSSDRNVEEVPRTGGSLPSLMDELVKVGQVMGYKMDGCNSGGILCVWDPNSFRKSNAVVSDYFIMIRGVWRQTGNDLLIIAVYAPHDLKDKQMLWDYLTREIVKWKGEVVIMGDFNEVRFLISENLLNTCPNITAITLERYLSDHRPILLRESHFDYGPISFRFFHHWIEMEGFSKVVEDAWREAPCDASNAMINMMMKLKYLKAKIREWNKKNTLSAKNVKAKHKDELEALEAIIDKGDGNVEVVNKRMEVVNSLQKIDKIHSSEMAQKAKVKWSIEGDENTSFFHGMLNKKWSLLNIRGIMVDGMWIESPNRVKGEFFHHFSSRFDKPDDRRAHIEMRYPKTLTCDQQVELESDVSNEEIKRAVWDCGTDKSPGPDGFTFGFYRRFWNLIENDVYDVVKYFFTYGVIPKGCNSSFIALILKILDANMVKDFRPISLIGSLYKIIAKIWANRLVGVLGDIVNEVQSAFIAERQILDGPFILNEVLQWCKMKRKQSLIFKVDFEKAYDSVRWDFLDDILKKIGFGEKWCKWIQSCLRSSRGSIIINGSPTKEFQFFKGLKQGDPLSPFLFILIMESLHLSFQRVVDAGMFNGIKLSSSLNISHMFEKRRMMLLSLSKDKIMGVLVDSEKVKCVASKLGCLILKTPFSYLGSKVGGSMSRVHAWTEVVDRVKNRLSKWKMKALSIGGLMFKWVWRFYTQNTSLWVPVIKAIHGDDEKVRGYVKAGNKSCWLSIVHEINALKNKGINLLDSMHVKLGNGDKTAFWEDIWIEGNALKNRYPRIYGLETCKSITVGMKFAQPSLDSSFRRVPRGGVEQEQFDDLSALVHDVTLAPMSDRWNWALESSGEFSVASVKGIDIDSIMCVICDNGAETSSHLFFSCRMVRQIVRMITRWWDVPYVEVDSYEGWITWLVNLRLSSKHKQMLEGVFYVTW